MALKNRFNLWFAGMALSAALMGCANPEGEFDNYIDRYEELNPNGSSASTGGSCTLPMAGAADGDFFYALSPSFGPTTPIVFLATVTSTDGASGLDISMSLQPLSAMDRMTAVGDPIVFNYTAGMDGSFMSAPQTIAVAGAANPLTGTDITAENVVLSGSFCTPAEFLCGSVAGEVTAPVMLSLENSTFTMQRVTGPADYPEPPQINCDGDLAKGVGE